jgi:hypothetical protein
MAVAQGYGKTVTSGSVFAFDTGDTRNSYIGEPTTNLALFSVISGITFNADYGGTITQTADYVTTYKGRPSLKVVSTSQWNIYKYPRSGNYTATSSTVFTFSWKMKWSDGRVPAINNGYIYTDAQYFYPSATVTAIEDGWYLCQVSTSGTNSPLWLTGFDCSQTGTCYITDWQAEAKSHATQFTPAGTTRSATQGLLPLVGNSTLDLTNMSFDSNAQMTFDGTDDYVNCGTLSLNFSQGITVEAVANFTSVLAWQRIIDFGNGAGSNNILLARYGWSDDLWFEIYNGGSSTVINTTGGILNSQLCHYMVTVNGTTAYVYRNGVLINSGTFATVPTTVSRTNCYIGKSNWADYYYQGIIPVVKMYNRALSAGEVRQNYLHYKTRFNLS